jgi:hypothetical protein
MATALFITREDLVRNTAMSGNVDTDKFIQFIKVAQEIHIQNYLGTKLYDKISSDVIAGTLAGDYLELVTTYVQPMLEYLPFAAYTIANKGVYKHTAENSETVSKTEVDYLSARHQRLADYYTQRFMDYMSFHAPQQFPEYYENRNEDVWPDKKTYYTGWVL